MEPARVAPRIGNPRGLELKSLGYQDKKIKANKYFYNGKEHIPDLSLYLYDYGARMYDPVLGSWSVLIRWQAALLRGHLIIIRLTILSI
jgi:hypothetical protein